MFHKIIFIQQSKVSFVPQTIGIQQEDIERFCPWDTLCLRVFKNFGSKKSGNKS